MSFRVNHINKKTGVIYVYESESYWDKERRQSRNRQVCIGKIDPGSGIFVPSKRLQKEQMATLDSRKDVTAKNTITLQLLDELAKRLGLDKMLKSVFGDTYRNILMTAYYICMIDGPLNQCTSWINTHTSPSVEHPTTQEIIGVLESLDTHGIHKFLAKWRKRLGEDEVVCFNLASISNYSELADYLIPEQIHDHKFLPRLNLVVLFGQNSALPIYYHRVPARLCDTPALRELVTAFKAIDKDCKIHYVMDKTTYCMNNVDVLVANQDHFTLPVPLDNSWLQEIIEEVGDHMPDPNEFLSINSDVYCIHSRLYPWGADNRSCYLHLYYSGQDRAIEEDRFNEELACYKFELESNKTVTTHQQAYDTYFTIKNTPKRGLQVSYNLDAISTYVNKYAGFQAILSSGLNNPVAAMRIYQKRNLVEKFFNNMKNPLDMKRLRLHSPSMFESRLFVQFIALILTCALRNNVQERDLVERYTVDESEMAIETETENRK